MEKTKKKIEKRWQLVVIMIMFFGGAVIGEAAGSPISVKAILPENQLKNDNTYYDILMTPGQEQDLKLQIFNSSNKEEEVEVKINAGLTSDGGSIDYSQELTEDIKDDSMRHNVADMIKIVEPRYRVPANESITVNLHIKAPSKSIDGVILGAVTVRYAPEEEEEQDGQMAIVNNMAFVNSIKITMTDTAVEADLVYMRTYAAQNAGRNQVNVKLQNPKQMLLNHMVYSAQVYEEGKTEVLHEAQAKNYRVAPTSNFNFPISWEGEAFKAGDYVMKMKARSEETGQDWEWNEKFTITTDEAKKLNASAVDVEENLLLYYVIGGVIGLLILIMLIVIIVKMKKTKKQEALEKQRREKMTKKRRRRSKTKGSSRGEKR